MLGGRPTDPTRRFETQAEVVRLRGMESMTFQAIGIRLGISDRQAQILWTEYWQKEHATFSESAEAVRADILTRLRLLRDTAFAFATNPRVKVSKSEPGGGTIELADFEKVAKMSKLALHCMAEEAKLCAAYNGTGDETQPGVLWLIDFTRLAQEHMEKRESSVGSPEQKSPVKRALKSVRCPTGT